MIFINPASQPKITKDAKKESLCTNTTTTTSAQSNS